MIKGTCSSTACLVLELELLVFSLFGLSIRFIIIIIIIMMPRFCQKFQSLQVDWSTSERCSASLTFIANLPNSNPTPFHFQMVSRIWAVIARFLSYFVFSGVVVRARSVPARSLAPGARGRTYSSPARVTQGGFRCCQQRLCKIISTRVKFHFVSVLLEQFVYVSCGFCGNLKVLH